MRQLMAVFRLEIAKSFFSRRGLWIYLLALIPILIWVVHGAVRQRDSRRATITREQAAKVQVSMSHEEVIALLGEPSERVRFGGRRNRIEQLRYYDGTGEHHVNIREGKVTSIHHDSGCELGEELKVFAAVFQFFFVRLAIFFGCLFVFMNLFRGEILDKSLHYYFLAPVRREIVVAGKFLAGLSATVAIFGMSTVLQMVAFAWHFPKLPYEEYLAQGQFWPHLFGYVGEAAMACVGYGSVFLAAGIFLRNPLIPAVTILMWESISGVLPSLLRKFSVIYWLKSMAPVEVPIERGVPPPIALLALNVEPAPAIVAVLGLLAVASALLYLSARKVRTLQINYE
jgi:hypothetical protein